jgi:hypothetical protein
MSFSELSTTIISQAVAVSSSGEKLSTPERSATPSSPFVRLPDHRALIGKAILSFQVIVNMTLPEGWMETRQKANAAGQRVYVEYGCSQNTEICVSFSMAERPLDPQSRLLLLQILQLSSPADIWIKSLAQAQYFGAIANAKDFVLLSARSGQVSGRRALIMEGSYPLLARSVYAVIVDADCGGRFPLAICYESPKEDYASWLRDVLSSLNTIAWK